MHLAQHHFQVQSQYFENSIAFALDHLFFSPYGMVGGELDTEALRNGTVAVVHARGVMPDGLAFHFPDCDPVPEPRDIQQLFSPTQHSHVVHLVIPAFKRGHSNCADETASPSADFRYLAESRQVSDETTGLDEKAVRVGRKNFRLLLDIELPDDTVSLPIARVRRDRTGHFEYDPDFIPPCLQIGASQRLLQLLSRLVSVLQAKSDTLVSQRSSDQKSLAEYAAHEVATFWLAHTIHSSLAPLKHHLDTKRSGPEHLYQDLSRLAGALCTFALDRHPRDLPAYDHDRLEECFNELDRHIRDNLEVVVPTNCIRIPLERTREFLFQGQIPDKRCFGPSRWIFSVRSSAGEAQVIRRPARVGQPSRSRPRWACTSPRRCR
jgi:type VI secretion system protein ImpJ